MRVCGSKFITINDKNWLAINAVGTRWRGNRKYFYYVKFNADMKLSYSF